MDSRKPLKPAKQKTCKTCKQKFTPFNSLQATCPTAKCAVPHGKKLERKAYKATTRAMKKAMKSRSDWLREAQQVFNAYIRARDKGKPCISCDKPDNDQHQRHASHYRSVGACSALRFNTFNVHTSCATCNSVLSGNLIEYRIRLVKKIGAAKVGWLECQNKTVRYEIEYLAKLKKVFSKRTRRLLQATY